MSGSTCVACRNSGSEIRSTASRRLTVSQSFRDAVAEVGRDDVRPGAAADPVDEPVERLDPVGAAAGEHAVTPAAGVEVVGAHGPAERLGTARPEPVGGLGDGCEHDAGQRGEGDDAAHALSVADGPAGPAERPWRNGFVAGTVRLEVKRS